MAADISRGEGALPTPGLAWERGHTPMAERFGDIYYSRDGGLAQSRQVFLGGNDLPQAWQHTPYFVIAELGFGTGLNFLAAWDLWRRTRPPGARLHYIAVEGFPLSPGELRDCVAPWPELADVARGLLAAYPDPQRGFLRVLPAVTPQERGDCTLTILFGDAAAMLGQLEADVDGWFLDGFAPDRNPDMWSDAVFGEMARLSRPGATAATYSVAGTVRRGLDAAGFDVARAPGFGGKREMLRARFRGQTRPSALQPWFARPPHAAAPGRAAIVGAGLAGAHTAAALSRRGWRTTVVDQMGKPAGGASGCPRAVMAPRLTAAPAHDGRFYAAAWRFALSELEGRHARVGTLQIAQDGDPARFDDILSAAVLPAAMLSHLDATEASDAAGVRLSHGGLYFPQGGWQEPGVICTALTASSEMRLGTIVSALRHDGGHWHLLDADGRTLLEADIVVLAGALGVKDFRETSWLPIEARRGQLTISATNEKAAALRTVLSYGGYVTPAHHGLHVLGATFDHESATDVRPGDHARNFQDAARIVPGLFESRSDVSGFAAVRCMSPDHMPIVGPVPDHGPYLEDFSALRHGHPWARYPHARYQSGLYVLTGLGARGAVSAPLAAELLAAQIGGEPWPLERDLVTALHPARFLVRELKRREI